MGIHVTVLEKHLEKTVLLETLPVATTISQQIENPLSAFICSESLMHCGQNMFGFKTKGKGSRLFGDLRILFIAT